MLYYLSLLKPLFSPLNVFQYITFRSAGAFLTALFVSLAAGPGVIEEEETTYNYMDTPEPKAQRKRKKRWGNAARRRALDAWKST